MNLLLAAIAGALLGAVLHGFGGAVFGALLGFLLQRIWQLEQTVREQVRRLDALHVLFEEGRHGERIRILQQRVQRLEGGTAGLEDQPETVQPASPQSRVPQGQAAAPAQAATEIPSVLPVTLPEAREPESGTQPAPPLAAREGPASPDWRLAWLSRLLSGNPLARIGVILLFFGIASGFKLAIEHGWFPLPLRALLTASLAVTMIAFGWQQRHERPRFADALQGGGFAILYLIVFFMLSRWGWIDPGSAFAAFIVLAGGCIVFALYQSTQALAILGSAGGFLAPVLASTGQAGHIVLFSFYLLLGVTLVAASAWRGWRLLPLTGMVLTFAVGLAWAWKSYEPAHYVSTQVFLLAFFLLYGLWPLALGRRFALATIDATLVLGAPLATIALQYSLVHAWRYGFAASAALAGIFYLALWTVLRRRKDWLPAAYLGLGMAMLTLAVPFAFDVAPSAGLWAAEGAAGVALAGRQHSRLGVLAGVGLQLLAGLYLLSELGTLAPVRPLMNGAFLGSVLVAGAGFASAWLLARLEGPVLKNLATRLVVPLLGWALLWWFGAAWRETWDFVAPGNPSLLALLLHWAGTVLALEVAGRAYYWNESRSAASLLNILLLPALLHVWHVPGHALAGVAGPGWVVALAAGWGVRCRQDAGPLGWPAASHALLFWVTLGVLASEVLWRTREWLPPDSYLVFVLPVLSLALLFCSDCRSWPVGRWPQLYRYRIALPLARLLLLATVWLNALVDGSIGGLPYQPLLSLFDVLHGVAFYAVWRWTQGREQEFERHALGVAAFVWLTLLPARVATSWFGVRFGAGSLLDSPEAATGLALVWTALALALMWFSQRQASRISWFAGFGLLCVVGAKLLLVDLRNVGTLAWTISLIGVALLVLAASYVAPAPPKEENRD